MPESQRYFGRICGQLEGASDVDKAVLEIIISAYKNHSRIIFNGNGYSEEWAKEAEKRGLTNLTSSNEALKSLIAPEMISMFEEIGMVTKEEANARYTAYAERYVTQLTIESRVLIDIANKNILPSAVKYANIIAENVERTAKFGKEFCNWTGRSLKVLVS